MRRSLQLQIAAAFILAALCLAAAYLHAPFFGWPAACFIGFGLFRAMEGPGPGNYKLKKHLYGLFAWLVLFTVLFYPGSWTYAERDRIGGTYV